MAVTTESAAFFHKNLARSALRSASVGSDLHFHTKFMTRDERFALYNELDERIVQEAVRLSQEHKQTNQNKVEFDLFFPTAAANVVDAYTKTGN